MASVNKVILIGNVGKDPEIKRLESGAKIAKFSVATHETYKNKEGAKMEQTEWHNVVILRDGLADIAEKYLGKGKQIYIEGKIRTRNWEDKDGIKKSVTEIIADNFIMLGRKRGEGTENETPENDNSTAIVPPVTEEPAGDLPF
jgi:single-strand DNA-binding protein